MDYKLEHKTEESIGGRLLDIGLCNDVLDLTPKRIKTKINSGTMSH